MASVSDWKGSIRNYHFKLPENLICCNHHFVFLELKKTIILLLCIILLLRLVRDGRKFAILHGSLGLSC